MLESKMLTSLVLLTLLYNVHPCNGLRILGIHAFQARSHYIMFEELLRGLATKGHQVDVYGHYPLKIYIPNFTYFSLEGLIEGITNNMTFDEAFETDGVECARSWIEMTQDSICGLFGHSIFQKLIHNPPNDPPYDIVITELSVVHCYIAFGRHLNIPVVGLVTMSLLDWHFDAFGSPINLAMQPTIGNSFNAPMTFSERLVNFINYYRMNRMYYQTTKVQDEYVEKYFGPGYPKAFDLHKDVSLVLTNHEPSLSGMIPFAPKVIPVGGLHVVDHNELLIAVIQKWLDESKDGCIYFSFGSFTRIETFPKHILKAFYEAFENIKPTRVLLKIARPEELPPGLPSNVLTRSWFQQVPVLKHKNTKVFVTHGGLMGGQESIYFGVPMVGVPILGDQYFNVRNYISRKVAVQITLSEITGSAFTSAINEVLNNPIYRESMRKLSNKFRDHPLTPMDTAIYWIEYIHRHGKDALRSPSENLLWWQKSLLDIYLFLCGTALIILFIIMKVIKICISFVLTKQDNYKLKTQ